MKVRKTTKNGKAVWRCSWTCKDTGNRKFKQFKTKLDGENWIADQKSKKNHHGKDIASVDTALLGQWLDLDKKFRAMGKTLALAGDHCLSIWSAKGVESITHTLELYIAGRKKVGRQDNYLWAMRGGVTRLLSAHPNKKLMEMPVRELSASLVKEAYKARSGDLTVDGLNEERRKLNTFFNWCKEEDLIAENPTPSRSGDSIIQNKKKKKPVAIMTPVEARELLRQAHALGDSGIMCYVVLGLFCGLRPDSSYRYKRRLEGDKKVLHTMTWGDIQTALRTGDFSITDKTGHRTMKPSAEAKVWMQWLVSHYGIQKADSPVATSNWDKKIDAFHRGWRTKNALPKWPTDLLRHSYGTYRMHKCETVSALADEMGNTPRIIERHYYKRGVDPVDIKVFWGLTPDLLEDYEVDIKDFKLPVHWSDDITHKIS